MNQTSASFLDVLRAERDAATRHFEALDTKAGIVLAFSGLLAALQVGAGGVLLVLGRTLSVVAALLAIAALLPRRFPVLKGTSLQRLLANTNPDEYTVRLIGVFLRAEEQAYAILRSKARLLLIAGSVLGIAVVSIGTGSVLRWGNL